MNAAVSRSLLFLFALAPLAGCKRGVLPTSPDTGVSPAVPQAASDAGLGADRPLDLATTTTADGPAAALDAAPDQRLTLGEASYLDALDRQTDAWIQKMAACFNESPAVLRTQEPPFGTADRSFELASVRGGRIALDPAKLAECLASIQVASCDAVAVSAFGPACDQLHAGLVATEGACERADECRNAPGEICWGSDLAGCASRCRAAPPPARLGEPCGDKDCIAGSICRTTTAGPDHCAPPLTEGAACLQTDWEPCVSGHWCRGDDPDSVRGTCRKIQAGSACAGAWQCPGRYICVVRPGETAGVCGAGLTEGAACQVLGLELPDGPFDTCALGLFCRSLPGGGRACAPGYRLGEDCTAVDVGGRQPYTIPCLEGDCQPQASGRGACVPLRAPGASCAGSVPCAHGLACIDGLCGGPAPLQVGDACGERTDGRVCPDLAYCRRTDPVSNSARGTCTSRKVAGQTCDERQDECLLPAACLDGVCRPC